MPSLDNIKVLVLEPANQAPPRDMARPNGSLGPAYLVGALRRHGIYTDYLDVTVGWDLSELQKFFFNRTRLDNGNLRYGLSDTALAEIISGYDVIATSSIFSLQTRMHFEVARTAKEAASQSGKKIFVVSGGVNARALREHFLSNNFDIIALGDGEQTIIDIVEQLTKPKPDFTEVNGIAFRIGDKTITNPVPRGANSQKNLDYLPAPALDSLPLDIYEHLDVPHGGKFVERLRFAPIQTSRGCQDKCTFCHISVEKKETDLVGNIGSLRGFSTERIASDVDQAVDLGINRLYFEDDNLFYGKRRLAELAPCLKREGLEYSNINGANIRFLFKKTSSGGFEVDTEFIEMLADFGLVELALPFETSNVEIMNKYASGKYDLENMDSVKVVKALRNAGIRCYGSFMFGFRDEPWESMVATKDFAKVLIDAGLNGAGFNVPVPYPGSLDFEYVMRSDAVRHDFNRDPLSYTDHLQNHGKPLFPTVVSAEKIHAAVEEFWLEINDPNHTSSRKQHTVY